MNIEKIISSWKTIFSVQDLLSILDTNNSQTIRNYLSRIWKKWILQKLYYGIWWLAKYDIWELASKLKKPSYISFETILYKEWIIFQHYGNKIFSASNNTISKETEKYTFNYVKLKNSILQNPLWIISNGNYMFASKERAICDRVYISGWYYFDNLQSINKEKLIEISKIYNKRVEKEIQNLIGSD